MPGIGYKGVRRTEKQQGSGRGGRGGGWGAGGQLERQKGKGVLAEIRACWGPWVGCPHFATLSWRSPQLLLVTPLRWLPHTTTRKEKKQVFGFFQPSHFRANAKNDRTKPEPIWQGGAPGDSVCKLSAAAVRKLAWRGSVELKACSRPQHPCLCSLF